MTKELISVSVHLFEHAVAVVWEVQSWELVCMNVHVGGVVWELVCVSVHFIQQAGDVGWELIPQEHAGV